MQELSSALQSGSVLGGAGGKFLGAELQRSSSGAHVGGWDTDLDRVPGLKEDVCSGASAGERVEREPALSSTQRCMVVGVDFLLVFKTSG